MAQDNANIYKLDTIPDNLWADTCPEIKQFSDGLMDLIKKSNTPYVLGLEGGYGTGKTYFSSRFCEHLNRNKIVSVYFSAWEKDYLPDPFLAFAEEIIQVVRQETGIKKTWFWKKATFCTKIAGHFVNAIDARFPVLPNGGSIGFSMSKFTDGIKSMKKPKEPFKELKKSIAEFIKELKNKNRKEDKLVLVVDELDRCRPDYAIKVLETIKHFFDIEGLFIVLPIHKSRLENYINGFYNIESSPESGETYFQKFINNIIEIPDINYEKICRNEITANKFTIKNIIKAADSDKFNSIEELVKWTAEYAKNAGLTYRETKELISNHIIFFCNNHKEPIRCRLLAHRACLNIYGKRKVEPVIQIGNEKWCYYLSEQSSLKIIEKDWLGSADFNNKLEIPHVLKRVQYLYRAQTMPIDMRPHILPDLITELESIKNKYGISDTPKNFTMVELSKLLKDLNLLLDKYKIPFAQGVRIEQDYIKKINEWHSDIKNKVSKLNEIFELHTERYGSDDNDAKRLTEYDKLLKNPSKHAFLK